MYMTIMFKQLFLRNCLANQSQTLCGSSLGRGNESLYKWSWSHDKDGHHGYKYQKFLKKLLQNQKAYDFETWHEALRNGVLQNLYKMTLG